MASYNRVIMIGNLTRDPDYKQLASGQAVCRLGLASNRQFKNRQSGDMVQEVCYVDIDVWGPQAESCRQYLQKGRSVLVEGRLKLDTWQDQEGQNRSKHSIVADRVVFLSSAAEADTSIAPQKSNDAVKLDKDLLDQISAEKFKNEKEVLKAAEKSVEESVVKPATTVQQAAPKVEAKTEAVQNESFTEAPVKEFRDEPPFQDDLPF
jgi:single-strand DNA-binding protein